MIEYIVIFLILLGVSIAFYLLWERFTRGVVPKRDSAQYVQALRELLDDNMERAFGLLRQVVAEDSSNVDAYLRLGRILRDKGRPDRALQVHKDLTLRGGLQAEQKASILGELAEDYIALDESETAISALRELISLRGDDRRAFDRLLHMQKQTRQWGDAFQTASTLLKMESEKTQKSLAVYKYQLGQELLRKREYHKARVAFKEALGLDPGFVPAYLSTGDSYCEEERFEDAVSFWLKLVEAVPDQGHRVIERLKKTLFDLGRFGDLLDICRNILDHSPQNIEVRLTLAELHEKKGDLDSAQEVLVQTVDDHPDNLRAVMELIRIYLERDDKRKVFDLFRRLERRLQSRSDSSSAAANVMPTGVS
ncbi:MAG: tetratricopeptide repeat protein [Candidatus Zixiibacteriota bacterium]